MVAIFSSSVVEMYTRTNEIFCEVKFLDRLYIALGMQFLIVCSHPLLCTSKTMNHECQCWQWPQLTCYLLHYACKKPRSYSICVDDALRLLQFCFAGQMNFQHRPCLGGLLQQLQPEPHQTACWESWSLFVGCSGGAAAPAPPSQTGPQLCPPFCFVSFVVVCKQTKLEMIPTVYGLSYLLRL